MSGSLLSPDDVAGAAAGGSTLNSMTRNLEQIGGRVSNRVRSEKSEGSAVRSVPSTSDLVRMEW